jgi:hypothetical protein
MVDKIPTVTLSISEDAEHTTRRAIKDTEDEMNRLVVSINKALVQLEDLIVVRTAREE